MIAIAIAQLALTAQLPVAATFELKQLELKGGGARVNVDLIFTREASSQGGRITHSAVHVYDSRGQYIESFDNLSFAAHREGPFVPLVRTYSVTGEKQVMPNLGSRIPVTGFPILGGGEIVRDDWKGIQINPLLHNYLYPGPGSPPGNLAFSNRAGDLRIIQGNNVTPLELPEGFQFSDFIGEKAMDLDIYWAQDNVILGRISGTVPSSIEPGGREFYSQNVRWVDGKLHDSPMPPESLELSDGQEWDRVGWAATHMNKSGTIVGKATYRNQLDRMQYQSKVVIWEGDRKVMIDEPDQGNMHVTGLTGDGSVTGYTIINDISRPYINVNGEWHDVFETLGIEVDHGRIYPFHSLPQALVTWSKDKVSYTAILTIKRTSAPSDTDR